MARPLNSSPDHQRNRPIHLNLQKRSNQLDKGKAIDMGDSVDTGSSAKKSLNNDDLLGEEEEKEKRLPGIGNKVGCLELPLIAEDV